MPCGLVTVSNPYPNPVAPQEGVRMDFLSSCPTTVEWTAYTMAYRKVYGETLVVDGPRTVVWNVCDAAGAHLSVGLYFVRVTVGTNPVVLKLLVK
jgi:hypothetical protein